MRGKIVIVTGASGALGKVVAASALAKGARVAAIDHAAHGVFVDQPAAFDSALAKFIVNLPR